MDLGLSGRTALITGGSKGIGYAVAAQFVGEGCNVVLAARSKDQLASAASHLSNSTTARIDFVSIDTSRPNDREQLIADYPDVDILINNAGAIPGGSLDLIDDQRWRAAWDAKVFGYINLTRAYLEKMQLRRRGTIVNVIGVAGERPDANYVAGCTGNAALISFTRSIGGTSLSHGVRVLGVNPGPVSTDRLVTLQKSMAKAKFDDENRWPELLQGLPAGRAATPDEIANTVVFLASDLSSYTTGVVVNVDGGLSSRHALF